MPTLCTEDNLVTIPVTQCIESTLPIINNNFTNLQTSVQALVNRSDKHKPVRTFFYYGTGSIRQTFAANSPISYPSDEVILDFVNNETQLNLPSISYPGDVAYVICQRTGYKNTELLNVEDSYRWDRVLGVTVNNETYQAVTHQSGTNVYGSGGSWTVPSKFLKTVTVTVVGGGGGGGSAQEVGGGNGGGGGGSGGQASVTWNVNKGDVISFSVGDGGKGAPAGGRGSSNYGNPGGTSSVSRNGGSTISASGGQGGSGWGNGGGGGSPGGSNGGGGTIGFHDHQSCSGGGGGSGRYGGYGKGGDGASSHDRTYPLSWGGNNGSGGCVVISWDIPPVVPQITTPITTADLSTFISPAIIVWRLTSSDDPSKRYVVDYGFPKLTQATALNNTYWQTPATWSQF